MPSKSGKSVVQRSYRSATHVYLRLLRPADLLRAGDRECVGRSAVIGHASASHQAFSASNYSIPADRFPRNAVHSVVGIGGTVGAIGGMGMALFTGYILDATNNPCSILFAMAGSACFAGLIALHLLSAGRRALLRTPRPCS